MFVRMILARSGSTDRPEMKVGEFYFVATRCIAVLDLFLCVCFKGRITLYLMILFCPFTTMYNVLAPHLSTYRLHRSLRAPVSVYTVVVKWNTGISYGGVNAYT